MLENILNNDNLNRLVKGRHGYYLYNKKDVYIGKAIEKYGESSEEELKLLQQICQEGDVVIDIGANIGTHTLAFANFVGPTGRVYSFEPQPIIFQNLCANVAVNSLTHVYCHCMALGDENGYVRIPEINYNQDGNYGGVSVDQFREGHKVPLTSLDELMELNRLKLIKIDVEGMESLVLRGARQLIQKFQPALYVENDRVEKSKELIELLWSMNYELYWHIPKLFNPNNFCEDKENIFGQVASFNMLCVPKSAKHSISGFTKITDSSHHPIPKKS